MNSCVLCGGKVQYYPGCKGASCESHVKYPQLSAAPPYLVFVMESHSFSSEGVWLCSSGHLMSNNEGLSWKWKRTESWCLQKTMLLHTCFKPFMDSILLFCSERGVFSYENPLITFMLIKVLKRALCNTDWNAANKMFQPKSFQIKNDWERWESNWGSKSILQQSAVQYAYRLCSVTLFTICSGERKQGVSDTFS